MSPRAQGLRTWLLQRLSAAYMVIYILVAMGWLTFAGPVDFYIWQNLFASPLVNIFTQLFIYLLLAHAWIGVRDIFIDYIHHVPTRFVLLLSMSFLQLILAIWVFMSFYAVVQL